MTHPNIHLDIAGRVARVVIDRPDARNALSLAMMDAVADAVRAADADEAIRVIALTGSGDILFSAGVDLKELPPSRESPDKARAYDEQLSAAVAAVAACAKPTVALINGSAIGAAIGFTLACDIRLAAARAQFRIPVPKLGLLYAPVDTRRLVDAVGAARAKWLMLTGEGIAAETALEWGLVTQVFESDAFAGDCSRVLEVLADNAPLSLHYTKRIIDGPDPADSDLVDDAYARIYTSADPAEGLAAAREKRRPVFKGD